MKLKLSIAFFLVAITALPALAITKGEVADRQVANDVATCAKGYISRGQSGNNNRELWRMCLHASTELARRDKIKVANQVIRKEGYNVFEIEQNPGWTGSKTPESLTDGMIEMIRRGD